MKPIIIIPPDTMTSEDIQKLNDNDLCVVVSKDPSKVKFVDPIPSALQRTKVESAAIALSRKILRWPWDKNTCLYKGTVAEMYVELLVTGTPLDSNGSIEEQEANIVSAARRDELQRIAREEARAEAKAKREAKAAVKTKAA